MAALKFENYKNETRYAPPAKISKDAERRINQMRGRIVMRSVFQI